MTTALPRAGDVIECPDCGRVAVHARLLALCNGCGRHVRVARRAAPAFGLGALLFGRRAPRRAGA